MHLRDLNLYENIQLQKAQGADLWHVLVPLWDVVAGGLVHDRAEVLQGLGPDQAVGKVHHIQELGN